MFGALSAEYGLIGRRKALIDSLAGVLVGIAMALFNMFGYNVIMGVGEEYLDRFTLEAWELYVNYPLAFILFVLTYLIVRFIKQRYGLSTFFTILLLVSFVIAGWIYLSVVVFVAIMRIKYLIT
jgi:TRAP-type C4-dicarboxylate transport system permease small subunit